MPSDPACLGYHIGASLRDAGLGATIGY